MSDKQFVQANDLVRDAFRLARRIHDSGYRPDLLVALWRGGTPIGIAIHEYLEFRAIPTYHTALKVTSYTGIGQQAEPQVEGLEPLLARLQPEDRVLLIDDIFDSGRTLRLVRTHLLTRTRTVRAATLFYKPGANQTDFEPDYFLHTTDRWIVFPHEIVGLTPAELDQKDPDLRRILE